jgi:hypothetical protein
MNEQQRLELQRIKSILSAATGFEDDDQEYIEDARKAVCRLLDEQGREPVQSLQCAHCHVTIETLNDKVMHTLAEIERLQYEVDAIPAIKEERDSLAAAVLEQCRINGMSAEREDALRAELTRLKASIALDKKAENARELGLDYEPARQDVPETNFGNMAEPKIGCVNHDCDQCKAVQEQILTVRTWRDENGDQNAEFRGWHTLSEGQHTFYTTPPAPQPVPVKTYHDGKPWPVAPKPWVGLSEEDIEQGHKESWVYKQAFESAVWWAEKKLKEKNT